MEANSVRWQESMEASREAIVTAVGLDVALIAVLALLLIRDQRLVLEETRTQASLAERLESEVDGRTRELSSLSAYLQTNSEREKAKLARELHDELGGILTPAKMDLSWLQGRLGADPEYRDRMNRLAKLIDQGIDLKRRIIENLHPSLLDHLGLASALQWYVDETCKAANLECNLNIAGNLERLPSDLEIALYRLVQESVTNVVKHARAKKMDLTVERTPRGFAWSCRRRRRASPTSELAKKLSHGLAGMSHRIRSVQGTFDIRSHPGHGTRIDVFVPLEPKKALRKPRGGGGTRRGKAQLLLLESKLADEPRDGREILALVEEEIGAGLEGRDLERGHGVVGEHHDAGGMLARGGAQAPDHAEARALRELQVDDREVDGVPVARGERLVLGGGRGDDLDAIGHRHELDERSAICGESSTTSACITSSSWVRDRDQGDVTLAPARASSRARGRRHEILREHDSVHSSGDELIFHRIVSDVRIGLEVHFFQDAGPVSTDRLHAQE
jgi:signal transduction histidine kinase